MNSAGRNMSASNIVEMEQQVLEVLGLPVENIITLELFMGIGECPIAEVYYYSEHQEKAGTEPTVKDKKFRFMTKWEEV